MERIILENSPYMRSVAVPPLFSRNLEGPPYMREIDTLRSMELECLVRFPRTNGCAQIHDVHFRHR